ncbi:MAG: T9SS type A sorting domain-containing protein [Schleiferiaceae bacterium]|nr:T9SS type A sorting domain-containing protein [Schleiferiaceae bacterium]MDR9441720.1 T9SS type A sorting domain-containing protein [Schleiferiaceae bacterium]
MKKLVFSLVAILGGLGLSAQSLQVVYLDSLVQGNAFNDGDISGIAVVENISSDTVDVRLKRIDANYNALTDSNAICWGLCFTPDISVSPPSFTRSIAPGKRDTAILHVYPDKDGRNRSGAITYVFFSSDDPTDSVAYDIQYEVLRDLGYAQFQAAKPQLEVFPNPVSGPRAQFRYQLGAAQQAFLEVRNLVGQTLLRQRLTRQKGQVQLSTRGWAQGVYLYSLEIDGKVLETKKMILR